MRELSELAKRLADLEGVVARTFRYGTVTEVDAAKQRFRMQIGEEEGVPHKSAWIPYGQTGGAMKFHNPPSIGQQMVMVSPYGEARQAFGVPMTFSDQNASPASGGDEHVMTFGQVKVEIRDDQLKASVGGASIEATPDGVTITIGGSTLTLTSAKIEAASALVQATGAALKHNAKNVGDTHRHEDVTPGPALTGVPA
jgi:phage baseplate assembly protein V